MLWIIERILERLFLKSALQMSARKEADMELIQIESRADLLRRAKELEEEKVPGFEQLAVTLRKKAAEMGTGVAVPGADVLRIAEELQGEDEWHENRQNAPRLIAPRKESPAPLAGSGGKKRGRPRKEPLPDSPSADDES